MQVGDQVPAAYDFDTGETGARSVTATLPHRDWLLEAHFSDGSVMSVTEDHRFWSVTDDAWEELQHLDTTDVRSDAASYYASRILRLRTDPRVEAGLVTDTIYAAWTFWSGHVTAIVDTRLSDDSDPGLLDRLRLAETVYLPAIEERYRHNSIPFERRRFTKGWEENETDQHSLSPLK